MRKAMLAVVAALLLSAGAASGVAAMADSAVVLFGREDVGSGKNDPGEGVFHDSSLKANDKLFPRVVNITAGGDVEFVVDGFHQVAVCEEGMTPEDVDVPAFPPNLFINDADCPSAAAPLADATVTFAEPGRYLVICNITPHFVDAKMYGYVNVH